MWSIVRRQIEPSLKAWFANELCRSTERETDQRMVTPGRFELPTCGLGNRCSIHLSYGAMLCETNQSLALRRTGTQGQNSSPGARTSRPAPLCKWQCEEDRCTDRTHLHIRALNRSAVSLSLCHPQLRQLLLTVPAELVDEPA